ncbi:patatin [Cesiribacter sp. SM1]|uniref:patatin n=1 Tax=Cesiribacter sp. SM1 TaxID=2861196 RepID=UPI001CD6E520|nr:patatin [Cesiribacter sp. SM1]
MLYRGIIAIAIITLATGLGQVVAAPEILALVGAKVSSTSAHFFAIIGMFMCLFSALLLQALKSGQHAAFAMFWCGMQKFGAAAAIGLGVYGNIFSALALSVAAFDLLSGIIILVYWKKLQKEKQ